MEKGRNRQGKSKRVTKEEAPKKKTFLGGKQAFGKMPLGKKKSREPLPTFSDDVRLNKYIANAGICSRREADVLIVAGAITVNDEVITSMGYKVKPGDSVKYEGATVRHDKLRYVLLNKPKDFTTSTADLASRSTVIHLVRNACKESITAVGKMDKTTTGLLLFTNDGDLMKKLIHTETKLKKLYHVGLNRPFSREQYNELKEGITLPDGFFQPLNLDYVETDPTGKELGIEIATGKNGLVRKVFEQLGYTVTRLDLVTFGGLTKKDLPRGKYRFLTDHEVSILKRL